MSINLLAASPSARGLFQRAISQSGPKIFEPARQTDGPTETGLLRSLQLAEATGMDFLKELGIADVRAARRAPAGLLVGPPRATSKFWPVVGGGMLPEPIIELYEAGDFKDTPVLIGFNSDDGGLDAPPGATPSMFNGIASTIPAGCKAQAEAVLATYPHTTDAAAVRAFKHLSRDVGYAWNTWVWARVQTRKGRGKAYVYYFDVRTPRSPEGSPHGAEVSYVFGNFATAPGSEDLQLSNLIRQYWINFAATGDPNGATLPAWPAFEDRSPQTMNFDYSSVARPWPEVDRMKLMDRYFACIRASGSR